MSTYFFLQTLTVMLLQTMMMVDVFFGLSQDISNWSNFLILTNNSFYYLSTKTPKSKGGKTNSRNYLVDTSPNARVFIMNESIKKSKKKRSTKFDDLSKIIKKHLIYLRYLGLSVLPKR